MELKDRLRELRGRKSQRQCADDLNVKFTNYNKWESGINIPNYLILTQIADYYGVSLDYLTGRMDYKNPDYQQTTIDTGLTENALKELQKIRDESSIVNNKFAALNYLLEHNSDDSSPTLSDLLELITQVDYSVCHEVLQTIPDNKANLRFVTELLLNQGLEKNATEQIEMMLRQWREDFAKL